MYTKIIDFEIKSLDSYLRYDIFHGFQSGNGLFKYSKDNFLIKTLQERDIKERIKTAKNVLNTYLKQNKLTNAINKARKCVEEYRVYVNDKKKYIDLENYIQNIQTNLNNFKINLNKA